MIKPVGASRQNKGFTLLELVIALGVWMLLSVGVFMLWQHATGVSGRALQQQNVLENGRVAMDAMVRNIEIAHTVRIIADENDLLTRLEFPAYLTQVGIPSFTFTFNAQSRRLNFGGNNELASGIESIHMVYVPERRINITIQMAADDNEDSPLPPGEPLILHGSVDVRHKQVGVNP